MKTILVFLLSIVLCSSGGTKVFICDSPQAVAYHSNKNCRGLQKCVHRVLEVWEREALDKGLRGCKICY
jgi:hypothetical protein